MTLQAAKNPQARSPHWERPAATIAVFIMAFRYSVPPNIPVCYFLALCLLPVTVRYLTHYRGAVIISGLCILSALSGLLLTMQQGGFGNVGGSLTAVQTARVLGIALVLATLLWARTLVGIRCLVLTFGVGSLASLIVSGVNPDNAWKFSLSVPVALIALSLPAVAEHRWRQVLVVLALVAVSALNDSRSAAGLLLMAVVLTVTQRGQRGSEQQGQWRAWVSLGRIALIGIGVFFVTQAAILEGMLGEAARIRTEAQIALSGSSIVGGRPEMGAALALIYQRPWGYGAGTLVTYDYLMLAKSGMNSLGYNTRKNGYVEQYMFGQGFEVHSVLGDMWILFGIAGAALAVVFVAFSLIGLGESLSRGSAITVAIFLILRLTWDFTFSPFPSAMYLLPLTLAVALPRVTVSRPDDAIPRRMAPPGSG